MSYKEQIKNQLNKLEKYQLGEIISLTVVSPAGISPKCDECGKTHYKTHSTSDTDKEIITCFMEMGWKVIRAEGDNIKVKYWGWRCPDCLKGN